MIQNITKKISIVLLLFLYISTIIFITPVHAENTSQNKNIIFVVDCSNSMNFNDSNNLSGEMIKLFTDTAFSDTNIGIILYNDTILKSIPLVSTSNTAEMENIQQIVQSMLRKGNTDIGFALNEAVNIMPQHQQNTIILFSDGQTDLKGTKTTRTLEDSYNYENAAYAKANQTNTRIFTIALTPITKTGDSTYLKKIANQTNGKYYTLQHASQLPELFQNIYNELYDNNINIIDTFTGSGNYQKQIPMINDFADSSAIIIHTQYGIKNITADCNYTNIIYSQYYAIIQIKQPLQNNIVTIQFDIPNNDTVILETIHHINIVPQIEPFDNNTLLHLPINVMLYQNETGQAITNQKLYQNTTAELFITNTETGEIQTITMGNTGNMFTANFENKNPKIYRFQATVKNGLYHKNTPYYETALANTKPYITRNTYINLLAKNDMQQLNLNQYFNDDDGDTLTYQFAKTDNSHYAKIDKNILSIKTNTTSTKQLPLLISDGRGGVITQNITINILPFWLYYKNTMLKIVSLFTILFFIYFLIIKNNHYNYLLSTKNVFHYATFEGHFLNTASGNDIPKLNWNANYFDNQKSITLGELFYILDITEKLPESYKIYFNTTKNGKIIFYHNTNCSVIFKKNNIPKNKKITLQHKNKLNILFEDNTTQIELQYKIKQNNNFL